MEILYKRAFFVWAANYSDTLNFPVLKDNKSTKSTIYEIPRECQKRKWLIEIKYESIKLLDLYFSSNAICYNDRIHWRIENIRGTFKTINKSFC